MLRRFRFAAGGVFGAVLAASIGAYAALGGADGVRIPYSGHLDSNGSPVNGDYGFRFGLYDVPSGGTACAGVPDATATVRAGEFSVVVGPVPEACVIGKPVYLELSVKAAADPMFPATALTGRTRVYPALAALTSGRGDFNAGGVITVNGINGDAVHAYGTNAAFTLGDAANTTRGNLGVAGGAGAYSSEAATGDVVLRANTGKLLLQSGSGNSAISISAANDVTLNGNLQVNGTIRGASAGFGGMFSTSTFLGNPGTVCGSGTYISVALTTNPFTGSFSCPSGYNQQLGSSFSVCQAAVGTVKYDTYFCWK